MPSSRGMFTGCLVSHGTYSRQRWTPPIWQDHLKESPAPKKPRQEWMNNNLQKETSLALISDLPPVDILKPAGKKQVAANFRSTLLLKPSPQLLKQWHTYIIYCTYYVFQAVLQVDVFLFDHHLGGGPTDEPMTIPCWSRFQSQRRLFCRLLAPKLAANSVNSWQVGPEDFWWSLVTNSWHTSLMEVIRRSPVEVGSWNPIYLQDFIHPWWCWTINSMNLSLVDVDLSWCLGTVDGFFKWICDSSMLEKTNKISSQMVVWWWFTMARSKTSPTINKSKWNMRWSTSYTASKGFLLGKKDGQIFKKRKNALKLSQPLVGLGLLLHFLPVFFFNKYKRPTQWENTYKPGIPKPISFKWMEIEWTLRNDLESSSNW